MNSKAGQAAVLLVILVIISLVLSGGLFYFFQQERARNFSLQEQLEDVTGQLEEVKDELNEERKRVATLNFQIQESQERLDELNSKLKQEKSERQVVSSEAERLKEDLKQQESSITDLETKLNQAQEDIKNKNEQIKVLESEKKKLEAQLEKLEQVSSQRVELGTIVVGPEGSEEVETEEGLMLEGALPIRGEPLLEGKVLVVNKDYEFVVINLGVQDGVGIGTVFAVYRKKTYLGDVKVEKVHDTMSAAGFLADNMKATVREGDKVVQKVR